MQKLSIDTEMLQACVHGDVDAYSHIYRVYYGRLYVYGCRFTADACLVEDCIQEIFTQFWGGRSKFASVNSFQSYLFVSFRHNLLRSINLLHKSGTKSLSEIENGFELELSADQVLINSEKMYEQKILLNEAVANLTERQKEVIFLKFYENLSYQEIAAILGISVKATYKLFARAISELREVYQKKISALLFSISFLLFF